jgi:2-methylaconitate cis-trans-isomerase PrpF
MAGTGSMCTAAMSCVQGSIVHEATHAGMGGGVLRIGHPLGVMRVAVEPEPGTAGASLRYRRLGFGRTARRIMSGEVYVPAGLAA